MSATYDPYEDNDSELEDDPYIDYEEEDNSEWDERTWEDNLLKRYGLYINKKAA